MATDMYLDLDDIKGESKDKDFEEKIEVLAFSWNCSNAASGHSGSGGSGVGRADIGDLSISKYVDASTNKLIWACINGKHIPKGKLHIRRGGGDEKNEYLTYEMEEVYIRNYNQSDSSGGGELAQESVTLNFSKLDLKYKAQKPTGGGGDTPHVKIDIKAHTAEV